MGVRIGRGHATRLAPVPPPDEPPASVRAAGEADGLREACGIFGVFAPGHPVAHLTYLGLYALQHRGQESAGMAVSDRTSITVVKDMGLVSNVFDERTLAGLPGDLAIGQTRYSTTGSSTWRNAQPVYRGVDHTEFAMGHNGNLVNTRDLAASAGMLPGTVASDSDLIAELLVTELRYRSDLGPGEALDGALAEVLPRLSGAFSLVLADRDRIIGVRDPNGFRPLCLGRLDGGWVLASETPALDVVGAHMVRELDPGEVLVVDDTGCRSFHPFQEAAVDPRLCLFEFVYFARPDSMLYGQTVHQARVRMGEALASQAPAEADLVMGVPESGIPAAEGFARASGIPYGQGLVKNRYIGRSFIAPTQSLRAATVRMKLNPLRDNLVDQRLVVVDDSIVRGTTTRSMIRMLREAGAAEVHLRVSSPPYRWPCFYGMDTGSRAELLAANLTVDEIQRYLEVDSLSYLTIDRLLEATGATGAGFCNACLTGDYPVEIPADLAEGMFEAIGKVKDLERPGTPVSVGYGHELPTEDASRLFPRA